MNLHKYYIQTESNQGNDIDLFASFYINFSPVEITSRQRPTKLFPSYERERIDQG